jgi:hypothetical protein
MNPGPLPQKKQQETGLNSTFAMAAAWLGVKAENDSSWAFSAFSSSIQFKQNKGNRNESSAD